MTAAIRTPKRERTRMPLAKTQRSQTRRTTRKGGPSILPDCTRAAPKLASRVSIAFTHAAAARCPHANLRRTPAFAPRGLGPAPALETGDQRTPVARPCPRHRSAAQRQRVQTTPRRERAAPATKAAFAHERRATDPAVSRTRGRETQQARRHCPATKGGRSGRCPCFSVHFAVESDAPTESGHRNSEPAAVLSLSFCSSRTFFFFFFF